MSTSWKKEFTRDSKLWGFIFHTFTWSISICSIFLIWTNPTPGGWICKADSIQKGALAHYFPFQVVCKAAHHRVYQNTFSLNNHTFCSWLKTFSHAPPSTPLPLCSQSKASHCLWLYLWVTQSEIPLNRVKVTEERVMVRVGWLVGNIEAVGSIGEERAGMTDFARGQKMCSWVVCFCLCSILVWQWMAQC